MRYLVWSMHDVHPDLQQGIDLGGEWEKAGMSFSSSVSSRDASK